MSEATQNTENRDDDTGQPGTFLVLVGLAGPATVALVAYGVARGSVEILAVSVVLASAAFTLGGLLGFLFGIPRTLTAEGQPAPDTLAHEELRHRPNTNLEQISDWLTKILIGVGLVELTNLVAAVGRLSDTLAPSLGDDHFAKAFAIGLLVTYLFAGFLVGYLYTRLRLQRMFVLADLGVIKRAVDTAVNEVGKADARALELVSRQLDPDATKPTQAELDEVIANAPQPAKVKAFEDARRANRDRDPAMHALAIPVFRALIKADERDRYHRNHGELGYALMASTPPDYEAAENAITRAIDIRDRQKLRGWRLYDYNRARCRIARDPAAKSAAPSPDAVRNAILDDLRSAATDERVLRRIRERQEILDWLKRNGLTVNALLD